MIENVIGNNQKFDELSFHNERSYSRNVCEETNRIDDLIENTPSDVENDKGESKSKLR